MATNTPTTVFDLLTDDDFATPHRARTRTAALLGVAGGDGPLSAVLENPEETELKAKAAALVAEVRGIAENAEKASREFTAEERALVKAKVEEAKGFTDQAKAIRANREGDADLINELKGMASLFDAPGAHPVTGAPTDLKGRRKSLGERFVEDEAFKSWLKTVAPAGKIPDSTKGITSPPMIFRGLKDIVTGGSDTSAGALVATDWLGLRDEGTFRRELTIRDIITIGQTDGDLVEYARVTGFTNNAATVPEATGTAAGTATADVTGEKPESDLELEKVQAPVKTVAHWIPATKRALSDAGQIRTLIDNFLEYGLEEELEDQVIDGDNVGENFEGVLTVSGTTPQAWDTDILVTTRKAKTKVRTQGKARATAYVLNPEDNERIDLTKDDNGGFYFGGPATNGVNTLWGLPRVESEAMPAGTGVVADWRLAVLWDREQAAISVSDSHADFFIRNLVAILAELRAAFGILRPAAFVVIDLTA